MRFVKLFCDRCATVRRFEQPPCRDGHGADCDEWTCVACGAALLIGSYPPVMLDGRRRRRRSGDRRAA